MPLLPPEFSLRTEKEAMDSEAIHDYLANESYWALNIPLELVQKAIAHSLNFGLFHKDRQVGYARVISDRATMAYLCDVYILPAYQGQGLAHQLIEAVLTYPDLQALRRWILITTSADWLYEKYGFSRPANPDAYMEISISNAYIDS